jgi:hypothetical protein
MLLKIGGRLAPLDVYRRGHKGPDPAPNRRPMQSAGYRPNDQLYII